MMYSFLSKKERWFVSHDYDDEHYIPNLRKVLPKKVVPVIFPPIVVPVTEFLSDRLFEAVDECDCLVFIDTPTSKKSFWVSLEIEYAKQQEKKVFRFDSTTRRITEDLTPPIELPIYISFARSDEFRVREIALWAKHKRKFNLWYEEQVGGADLMKIFKRTHVELQSTMEVGGYLIAFVSEWSATRGNLKDEVMKALEISPTNVLLAWLDDPQRNEIPGVSIPQDRQIYLRPSPTYEHSFAPPSLDRWRDQEEIISGKNLPVLAKDIDKLIVRIYWMRRTASQPLTS